MNHETNKWNIYSIPTVLALNVLVDIEAIPNPFSPIEDRFLWGCSQDWQFTHKSTIWAMRNLLVHYNHKILNWMWKLNLLPNIKVFLWLTIREALSTSELIIVRRVEIINTCYLCNQSSKIIDHSFKCCLYIQRIWDHIKYIIVIPSLL